MQFDDKKNKEFYSLKNKLTNFCFYNLNIMKINYLSDDILLIIRNLLFNKLIDKYYKLGVFKINSSLFSYRDCIWKETPYVKLLKFEKEIEKIKLKNKIYNNII